MSNLFKSKTFKVGGLVIALAMAVVFGTAGKAAAQTTTVVAPAFTYSGTMRAGMSGPGISTLQAALNSVNAGTIVVDGKFGPATVAAVKMFQMNHGLVADGVVGPKTGAAIAQATVAVITVPSNFPAGCTSNAGFSTTTGMSCAVSMTLPAGCTSTSGFSTTTGMSCSTTMTLPAGCTSTSGFSSTTGMSCGSGSSSNNGSLSGGETDINNVKVDDADDDTINEGANKAPVADINFDVDDADAQLVRADVVFQAADGNEEVKPWRVFDKVYLMDGSTVLSTMDASDEDNWDDADNVITGSPDNQAYRIRFNNVNKVYKEGSNSNDLWVAADVSSGVDGSDSGDADWTVGLDSDGLRFTDGAGVDTFVDSSDTANFSIQESGSDSEVTVTEADSSPDSNTLEVKSNASNEQTVAVFNVDTDEDGGDVKLDDFPVGLKLNVADGSAAGTSTFADVISDVYVTINGHKYTGEYVAGSCGTGTTLAACTANQIATFRFDDIEDDNVIINAGDDTDVKVSVKFRSQGSSASTSFANGTTVQAFAQLTSSDVEDADSGDDVSDVSGGAQGDVMTLGGDGIMVAVKSATTDIQTTDDSVANNDVATFKFDLDVTAFGHTVYLNRDFAKILNGAASTCTADTNNVDDCYQIEVSTGATLLNTSGTIVDTTDAQEVVGAAGYTGTPYTGDFFYKISDGQTESFTITVTGTNQTQAKQVRAFLTDIEFTTDDVTNAAATGTPTVQSYTANLAQDSQTPFKSIQ